MSAVDTLREAISARPFRPFTVRVADQRSYVVRHPELISIGPENRSILVWLDDGGASIIDMLMIAGIDLSPPDS